MDLFGVDWSDGWAGNISAEAVGMVGGLLIAYLVADRVVKWRLREQRRPAKRRFLQRLEWRIRMLNHRFSIALGIAHPIDSHASSSDLEQRVLEELSKRLGPTKGMLLDELVGKNVSAAKAFEKQALIRLAEGILVELRDVSTAADRFAAILEEDSALLTLIADLEESAFHLERELSELSARSEMGFEDAAKLGLLAMCRVSFDHASNLRSYVAAHLA